MGKNKIFKLQEIQPFSNKYIVDQMIFPEISFSKIFKDLKKLFKIIIHRTSAASVWNSEKFMFARPDLCLSPNGMKLFELNIDSSVVSQSIVSYLQMIHNSKVEGDKNSVSLIRSLTNLVNLINKPVAFLGTYEKSKIVDEIDNWLVNQINKKKD